MKVILIKIYGEEEGDGTRLRGLRHTFGARGYDSYFSNNRSLERRGPSEPRRSHKLFRTRSRRHLSGAASRLHQVSPRLRGLLNAIYTSLSL